ncbi:MAG TPA: hypothetical protein VF803_03570, partial [Candidatus Paceibacterota bacterium]
MSSHLLPRLFPVPRILAMDGGGIDISDRSIRYFLFDVLANRREISTFGEVILPKGAIEGGDIRDRDSVVRALMQVRARCGFSFCYVSLPEQKGYIFDTTYDPNHSPPLDQAIEMALFEQVPMSPAEMVFDCEVVQGENEASANALAITA